MGYPLPTLPAQCRTVTHLSIQMCKHFACANLCVPHPLASYYTPDSTPLSLLSGKSLLAHDGLNGEGPGLTQQLSLLSACGLNRVGGEGSLEALVLTRKASVILPLFRNMNFETLLQSVSSHADPRPWANSFELL